MLHLNHKDCLKLAINSPCSLKDLVSLYPITACNFVQTNHVKTFRWVLLAVSFNFQRCEYVATHSIQAFYLWCEQINNQHAINNFFSNEAKLDSHSSVNASGGCPSGSFTMQARWSTSCCDKVNLLFKSNDASFSTTVCPTSENKMVTTWCSVS